MLIGCRKRSSADVFDHLAKTGSTADFIGCRKRSSVNVFDHLGKAGSTGEDAQAELILLWQAAILKN
jgi:hypothetical protein